MPKNANVICESSLKQQTLKFKLEINKYPTEYCSLTNRSITLRLTICHNYDILWLIFIYWEILWDVVQIPQKFWIIKYQKIGYNRWKIANDPNNSDIIYAHSLKLDLFFQISVEFSSAIYWKLHGSPSQAKYLLNPFQTLCSAKAMLLYLHLHL